MCVIRRRLEAVDLKHERRETQDEKKAPQAAPFSHRYNLEQDLEAVTNANRCRDLIRGRRHAYTRDRSAQAIAQVDRVNVFALQVHVRALRQRVSRLQSERMERRLFTIKTCVRVRVLASQAQCRGQRVTAVQLVVVEASVVLLQTNARAAGRSARDAKCV